MADLTQLFPGGFDHTAVAPDEGRDFTPLPAGPYEVECTGSEVKDAKSGNGCYLSLEFTVINPEQFAGRKVWANITLKNTNADAERIGQGQLSALCHACAITPPLKDSDHLFQKILRIRVKVKPADGTYQAKNEVTAYEALGAPQPTHVAPSRAPAPAAARPAAAAPAKTAPWKK